MNKIIKSPLKACLQTVHNVYQKKINFLLRFGFLPKIICKTCKYWIFYVQMLQCMKNVWNIFGPSILDKGWPIYTITFTLLWSFCCTGRETPGDFCKSTLAEKKKKELRFPLLFWGRSHIAEVVLQLTSELRMILNFPSSHVLGKEACNLILKDKLHRRVTVARTHASSTCVSEETLAKTACTLSPLLIKCIGHVSG